LWEALTNFIRYGTRQAAALAYYAVFSIFPLSLLIAVVIGGVVGPGVVEEQLSLGLSLFLPEGTLELVRNNIMDALQQGRQFGLVAVVGLIWAGLGLFSNITSSLDLIFHVPSTRNLWQARLVAVFMAAILLALVILSFLASGIFRLVDVLSLSRPSSWVLVATLFFPFGIDLVIFALLFRYVPARHVHWDAVWPAAVFGAIGWELLKFGFNRYLANVANFQFVYGSIATAIVLLFWAYLIASIFLLSAELCAQLNQWMIDHHRQHETEQYLDSPPLSQLSSRNE
jgi:membrane protein